MVQPNQTPLRARWARGLLKWPARCFSSRLASDQQLVKASGLFDAAWYVARHAGARRDPLGHYLRLGGRHGLSPGPSFDAAWYLAAYPDVAAAEIDPLLHFLRHGVFEGRAANAQGLSLWSRPAVFSPERLDRIVMADFVARASPLIPADEGVRASVAASGLFDAATYRARARLDEKTDPLDHFLSEGWRFGLPPSAAFDPVAYVLFNEDLALSRRDPLSHYVLTGRAEGRPTGLPPRLRAVVEDGRAALSYFEPALEMGRRAADPRFLRVARGGALPGRLRTVFLRLYGALRKPYARIVFAPWLRRGGADKVVIHALRAALETDGAGAVLLVLTDAPQVEAADWPPAGVDVLCARIAEGGREEAPLSEADQARLIAALIQTLRPHALLNINSRAAWEAIARYGPALAAQCDLYAMLFCQDFTRDLRPAGYADLYFRACLPHLTKIYFDNASFLHGCVRRFGVPPALAARLQTLYQPAPAPRADRPEIPSSARTRVLWAARPSFQKAVDLLPQIAQAAPELTFHCFGVGDPQEEAFLRAAATETPNLFYGGGFARFEDLRPCEYDAFLHTSRWDGLPNVLLEAGAAGLPLVASLVGGIGELIDAATGWPVAAIEEPQAYARALRDLLVAPQEARARAEALSARLAARHSWAAYRAAFAQRPSFLTKRLPAQDDFFAAVRSLAPLEARTENACDVSVVMTAHREGLYAAAALASARLAQQRAQAQGRSVEILAVLDRADAETRAVFAQAETQGIRIAQTDFGDPGLARNQGVALARGRWIAFLDSDDLFAPDWLTAACAQAQAQESRKIVWHPEINVYFGASELAFLHPDMEARDFEPAAMALSNPWTALCLLPATLARAVPYPATRRELGIAYEDWGWNLEICRRGGVHKIAPGTCHFIRAKTAEPSVMRDTRANSLPAPTRYFRDLLERNVLKPAENPNS